EARGGMANTGTTPEGLGSRRRPAILAGVIGNVLEWYDWAVYAYFVPTIAALFFPATSLIDAQLLAYATFGAGFLMRPLGSILFGIYGDRRGRRSALAAVTFIM